MPTTGTWVKTLAACVATNFSFVFWILLIGLLVELFSVSVAQHWSRTCLPLRRSFSKWVNFSFYPLLGSTKSCTWYLFNGRAHQS
jgi:hypothetical protein